MPGTLPPVDVLELHRRVPAAEELDLLEQHEVEQVEAEHRRWVESRSGGGTAVDAEPGTGAPEPVWTVTPALAVAYVLAELGGTVLDDGGHHRP